MNRKGSSLAAWARWLPPVLLLAAVAVGPGECLGQSGLPRIPGTEGLTPRSGGADAATSPAPDRQPTPDEGSVLDEATEGLARTVAENPAVAWGMLLGAILLGFVAGRVAASLAGLAAHGLARRGWPTRARLVADLAGPVNLTLIALGLAVGLGAIRMSPVLRTFASKTLLLLYTIAAFWYVYSLIGVIDVVVRRLTAKGRGGLDDQIGRQLTPLLRKSLRVLLVIIGSLFVADSVFDQNIGAMLAGLGIAGLGVSLAAQDSLKNIFGSITILFDRPFQLGERIVYGGYDGVIEEIGFRSTKLRTLTGHLVTIPNSVIVNNPVENIGRRPTIRRLMNLTIPYDTPRAKIAQAVEIIRGIFEEEGIREPIHPTVGPDEFPPRVFFNEFNPDSLNILVLYWYAPPNFWDFTEHAQRLNLRIIEEFEKAGIEFAFPTRTLYLAGDPKRKLAMELLGRDLDEGRGTRGEARGEGV